MASEEQVNNARRLREELDEVLFLQRNLTDEVNSMAKALIPNKDNINKMSEGAKGLTRAFRGVSNATARINSTLRSVLSGYADFADLQKEIVKGKQAESAILGELAQADSQELKDLYEQAKAEDDISKKRKIIGDYLKDNQGKFLEGEEYLLKLYFDQLETLEEQRGIYEDLEDTQKKLGTVNAIGGSIEGILQGIGAGGLASKLGFTEARREAESYALNAGKSASSLTAAGKYASVLGKNLMKALGPLAIFTELVKIIGQLDGEAVELQKSMSLSRSESLAFRNNLTDVADATNDINITTSRLLESFSSLNKQFGFITNFADDTLVTMTTLTKVVGTSAEAAGNLAAASSLTGSSFESNYKDVLATSYELQRQSGVQFDLRDILEQTGKVTGQVRANLGANPALIAKAITQAKLFGASLEDVANAGRQLLEFESSIENELQAELLLGRDINLERARAAALAGDQVTLAQELQQQAGTFSEFTQMNVLQQEALASAMGMQADQLADILMKQEMQGKSARELRALGKDELADRLESQTAQDKFNASVEKLKALFTDAVAAFTPILDIVHMLVDGIASFINMLGPFKGIIGGAAAGAAFGPHGAIIGAVLGGISSIATASTDTTMADGGIVTGPTRALVGEKQPEVVQPLTNINKANDEQRKTNMLLEKLLEKDTNPVRLESFGGGMYMIP